MENRKFSKSSELQLSVMLFNSLYLKQCAHPSRLPMINFYYLNKRRPYDKIGLILKFHINNLTKIIFDSHVVTTSRTLILPHSIGFDF